MRHTDPRQMLVVSLDFETLSLSPRATVIGLGAAYFQAEEEPRTLLSVWPISARTQAQREIDPATLHFWRVEPDESLRAVATAALDGDGVSLRHAFGALFAAVAQQARGKGVLWLFKPELFDGALMLDVCRQLELVNELDALTGGPFRRHCLSLYSLQHAAGWAGVEIGELAQSTTLHHPAQDALAQARSAADILRRTREAVNGRPRETDCENCRSAAPPRDDNTERTPAELAALCFGQMTDDWTIRVYATRAGRFAGAWQSNAPDVHVGSASNCAIRIDDLSLFPVHAEFRWRNDSNLLFSAVDHLALVEVNTGDTVEVGGYTLHLTVRGQPVES